MLVVVLTTLLVGALANNPKDDVQFMNLNVKSVKGGSYGYRGDDNRNRFFNNTQHGYVQASQNHEVGVCYIEVPTSTLARDPKHIPAGNGSRSDLSRIRTCCSGYIRNIHNYLICDPVCATECVNSLCSGPNTCTCFPDHVKNAAGLCVATCPIGCQNGHCNGGQCLCKEGFKLDNGGKFCVPHCRDNCGGVGSCTAPNTCTCSPGYSSSPDGSCRAGGAHNGPYPASVGAAGSYRPGVSPAPGSQCGTCIHGQCVGTECRCPQGYLLYRGECTALCTPNCGHNQDCVAPNVCAPKGSRVNVTQPNGAQYPYPNQQTSYQNPSPYPYPNVPESQHNTNQQNPSSPRPPGQGPPPNPIYAPYPGQNQYPGQQNQYPGQENQYPGQQNQYPGQQNQYPGQQNQWAQTNHGQSNGTNYLNQGQYPPPGQQHLYPTLPSNNYPYPQTNQGSPIGTATIGQGPNGQVYYQNRPYNPLADVTFNLQQGGTEKPKPGQEQIGTQGQYGGGQYSQGQYGHDQNSQGQYSHGQSSQGQYGQGQYSQGQYGQGQFGQGQYGQGQYNQGQYGQGQNNQGQYGQGQNNQGQYGQGQNNQGQYGQGEYPYAQNVTVRVLNNGNCEQTCVNGNCVGHNACECLPGYNLDPSDSTRTRCVPYCHGGCLNGHCASPNNCVCDEGYHKDFSVKGRSACVNRAKRSVRTPVKISDLLVFEIPDDE